MTRTLARRISILAAGAGAVGAAAFVTIPNVAALGAGGAIVEGTLTLTPTVGNGLWLHGDGPQVAGWGNLSAGEYTFDSGTVMSGAGVVGSDEFAGVLNVGSGGGFGYDLNQTLTGDSCLGGRAGWNPADAGPPTFTATGVTGLGAGNTLTGSVDAVRYGSVIIVVGTLTDAISGQNAPYAVALHLQPTTGNCVTQAVTKALLVGPAAVGGIQAPLPPELPVR